MKILNLGDGQGRTSGVTAVLQSTDDDSVDPHLERIKNQAGNEESDEEVLPPLVDNSMFLTFDQLHVQCVISLQIG